MNDKPAGQTQPFHFLALPFDVRRLVYRFLLHSRDSICPDVTSSLKLYTYHSEKRKEWYESHSIIDVAILRTCQQVHDEATAVLYGENAFTFDDWDYREKCVARRHHACRCPGETDLNLLYTWLHAIGRRNRRRIRRLRIILSHPAYMLCAGEERFRPDARDQGYADADDTMPQGQHLVAAFRLLALEHGLRRVKIEFDNKARWGKPELVRHFFASGLDARKVLAALASIRGLTDLSFDPAPEAASDEAVARNLRRLTCRTRPVVDLGDDAPGSAVRPELSPPELLGQKLCLMAERRQADVDESIMAREQKVRRIAERARHEKMIERLRLEEMELELRVAAADRRIQTADCEFGAIAQSVPDPLKIFSPERQHDIRATLPIILPARGTSENKTTVKEQDNGAALGPNPRKPLRHSLSMRFRRVLKKGGQPSKGNSK